MSESNHVEETKESIQQALDTACESLFKLRIQHKTGQLAQTHRLREAKKQIARLKTKLHQMSTVK